MSDGTSEIFYSGGYFLIRVNPHEWKELESDLIPDLVFSLSGCLCPKFKVSWGWKPGNKLLALKFGIPLTQLEAFVDWCQTDYMKMMDMWSMFYTPDDARQFINRFNVDRKNLYIIGTALPQTIEETEWQEINDEPPYGIEKRIAQHLPIEAGGELLGYEVVSFEYANYGHSWLCHYLHEDVNRIFGIRPNKYGLFANLEDAMTVLKWIQDGGDGGRAHHPPYDVWQLTSYPLEARNSSTDTP